MKKIKIVVSTGYVNCEHEDVFEFDDDVTEEEIAEFAKEYMWEHISLNWWEAE